jgi:5-methyltetrahydrofolate--homocysteine methyltransferase
MHKNSQQFLEYLKERVVVADGATGTMLQFSGLPTDSCVEEWNLSHPEVVRQIHQAYYEAGADFVETNTFGGNRIRLRLHGMEDKVAEINQRAVEHVQSVCPSGKFVAGSVGPSGEYLEPVGTMTYDILYEVFLEQITALIETGVDLLCIETMTDITELKAALTAAQTIQKDIPIVASMTFEKSATGFHTMMGTLPEQAIKEIQNMNPVAIGSNCGHGAPEMIELMAEFKKYTSLPLVAQANAGIPVWEDGKHTFPETSAERGQYTEKLLDLGVRIIGGCCGTTPEHIRFIRSSVDKFSA